jgi:hypothetical protein
LIVALGAVFLAALKLHILDTVKASGGGADSFPLAFAPYMLVFFAAIFLCACYVYLRLSRPSIKDNTIGLVAFSIPMLAAALGRCDAEHVLLNGLGIFLASMFYASNCQTAWKWYSRTFIVFLMLLSAGAGLWLYLPTMKRCGLLFIGESGNDSRIHRALTHMGKVYIAAFAPPAKRAKWEKSLEAAQNLEVPKTVDLSAIYPAWHGSYLAPFGYKPNGIGTYLSNRIDYGRYEGLENANTVEAIQAKLAEIKNHPEKALLLPEHFEETCRIDIPAERLEISILFAFPYLGKAVHMESVRQPICDYISAHYGLEQAPTPEDFGYGLWVAKPREDATSLKEEKQTRD